MDLLLIVVTIISILSTSLLVYMGRNPNFLKLKAQPKVAEIEQVAPVGWECTEYSQRLLEEKLVEAGAMEAVDMTICENRDCALCRPTRNLRRVHSRQRWMLKAQEESKKRSMVQAENERRAETKLKAGFQNVLDGPSEEIICRTVNIDGIAVVRPEEVPADANTTYYRYYDTDDLRDYLLVKWSWKEVNEDFTHRQRVPLLDSFHTYKALEQIKCTE